MRLDKYLTAAGITRGEAKAMIARGRVRVDGMAARDAGMQLPPGARVELDGAAVGEPAHVHLMLHKPAGILTATRDARARTVLDLVPESLRKRELNPVGRLDADVMGILLMTTDGQLLHRLISPKWEIEKIYIAEVEGELTAAHVERMAQGIALTDFLAKPARMQILSSGEVSRAELIVTEGKYHQVKRMFGALGRPVVHLHRRMFAGLALDEALAPGEYRALTLEEAASLYEKTKLIVREA